MEKTKNLYLGKAVIISLILILISVVSYLMGKQDSSLIHWLSYLILVFGVMWACVTYAKEMNSNVTFGNVFAYGFKVSALVTLILIAFTVIFLLTNPEVKQKALQVASEQMDNNKDLSDEQKKTNLEFATKFFYALAIGIILVIDLFWGVIGSLIGAAAAKKNPQSPFENQM